MRPFTEKAGGNRFPRKINHKTALGRGEGCISNSDHLFLIEKTQPREDVCEYIIGVANICYSRGEEKYSVRGPYFLIINKSISLCWNIYFRNGVVELIMLTGYCRLA